LFVRRYQIITPLNRDDIGSPRGKPTEINHGED
jgi:hypothetical protein